MVKLDKEADNFILYAISLYNQNNKPLSVYRLMFVLFLSDWYYTCRYKKRLFPFTWEYRSDLKCKEMINFLITHPNIMVVLDLEVQQSNFMLSKVKVKQAPQKQEINETLISECFLDTTLHQSIKQLISYFYQSYPMSKPERYLELDLLEDSKNFIKENSFKKS